MRRLLLLPFVCGCVDSQPGVERDAAVEVEVEVDTVSTVATTEVMDDVAVDANETRDVPLQPCPTSIGDESAVRLPGSTLRFYAESEADAYHWSLTQPFGSRALLAASDAVRVQSFVANVVGVYGVTLEAVVDGRTCPPLTRLVSVWPSSPYYIELVWSTPSDSNESDEGENKGSDLDLHFAHPSAHTTDVDRDGRVDPWFDTFFDCFWFNENPNWGHIDTLVKDDPALTRKDADGAGPESVTMGLLDGGSCYRIGVHYWNDRDRFGPADATVRVYRDANLIFASTARLDELDLWEVALLCEGSDEPEALCADGTTCEPRILPGYVSATIHP